MTRSLFRHEALEAQAQPWLGRVQLVRPLSLALVTAGVLVALAAVVAFLALAQYARRATVPGVLVPDRGLIRLVPTAAGTVLERNVAEGQAVASGDVLFVLALERTNAYKGVYHVLHGAISPVNGIGPEDLRIRELVKRVDRGGVNEIIIATNPGLEGDATAMYIRRELTGRTVRLTRLARGLPVGSDIEYADSGTLSGALIGRSDL